MSPDKGVNTQTGAKSTTSMTTLPHDTDSLAFDINGKLWSVTLDGRIYRMDYNATTGQLSNTWTQYGSVNMSAAGTGTYQGVIDILFDAQGNIYLLAGYGGQIFKLPADQVMASGVKTPTLLAKYSSGLGGGNAQYGMAWQAAGKILVSTNATTAANSSLFSVVINEANPTQTATLARGVPSTARSRYRGRNGALREQATTG